MELVEKGTSKKLSRNRVGRGANFFLLSVLGLMALFGTIFFFSTPYILAMLVLAVLVFFSGEEFYFLLMPTAILSLALGTIFYFEIKPNWLYEMTAGEALLSLAAAGFFLDLLFSRRTLKGLFDWTSVWLGAYIILGLISFGRVLDYHLYIAGLKVIIFAWLSYQLARLLIVGQRRLLYLAAAAAGLSAWLGLQIFYTISQIGLSSKIFFERSLISVPMGAIALVSAVLVLLLPVVLGFYFSLPAGSRSRPFILAGFVLGWLAVFITLGKGAILSLMAGLAYFFYKTRRGRIGFSLFFLVFAVLGVLILTPFTAGLITRLSSTFIDVNTKFRLEEYQAAAKIISEHPWLGIGSGQQLLYYQRAIRPEYRELVNNFFLQAWIDYGLVGLSVLILVLAGVFRSRAKLLNREPDDPLAIGLAAAMIVAFLNGLVEVTFFALPYAIVFWSLAGAMSAKARLGEA